MENYALRKYIRTVLSEYYNNQVVYPDDPTKFPYFDGYDKTPSDLDAEFDSKFKTNQDDVQEDEEKMCQKTQKIQFY